MESIENKILTALKKCGRGKVFFKQDFSRYSNPKRIQKALEQLTDSGIIIRVARGIYCYPKIDKLFKTGPETPSYDAIAAAVAKRDGAKIVPTGVHALNRLGLSTQIPTNFVYLTNGKSRKIMLANGKSITFVHTALKNMQFKNTVAMLITFALKSIGNENVTEQQITHIQNIIKQEGKEKIMQDIAKMPDWIKNIITKTDD
jgi:hypothetical protein